jgi:hypothetical protein
VLDPQKLQLPVRQRDISIAATPTLRRSAVVYKRGRRPVSRRRTSKVSCAENQVAVRQTRATPTTPGSILALGQPAHRGDPGHALVWQCLANRKAETSICVTSITRQAGQSSPRPS